MGKFNRYDRVKIMRGKYKDKIALITEAEGRRNGSGYNYIVIGVDDHFYLRIDEDFIESVPSVTEENIFTKYLNESSHNIEPKFIAGDVVECIYNPCKYYVVKESVLVNFGETSIYVYEVTPRYGDEDYVTRYEESSLTFQYHDLSYEKLFTEGTRIKNDLPEWRGELYNMYACYADIATHGALNKSISKEYEKDTLPPSRMFHVMRSHDIYNRIFDVIGNKLAERRLSNREFMCNRLNVDDDELTQISGMVMDKLNAMNLEDMDSENLKIASKRDPGFTETEKRFVALIDNLDISKKKFKDHFPVTMTALQMMDAIKDAYEHACKQGAMKIQKHDNPKEESLAAPHKGKRKYKGTSEKYHMEIEFWYNFDRDFIETAYPLGMNVRPEKY